MNHGTDLQIEEEELRSRRREAAAFRVRVDERLKNLEAQVEELKARINGLLSFLAGTVIAQILLGLFP
jgi:predicted  nucleic acid-binding Zn-ribbon protein